MREKLLTHREKLQAKVKSILHLAEHDISSLCYKIPNIRACNAESESNNGRVINKLTHRSSDAGTNRISDGGTWLP